jgi:hypothetical protein
MTPQKLRERRRARVEKMRRAAAYVAMAEIMASNYTLPTAKEWLSCLAVLAAIFAVIVGPILFFTS